MGQPPGPGVTWWGCSIPCSAKPSQAGAAGLGTNPPLRTVGSDHSAQRLQAGRHTGAPAPARSRTTSKTPAESHTGHQPAAAARRAGWTGQPSGHSMAAWWAGGGLHTIRATADLWQKLSSLSAPFKAIWSSLPSPIINLIAHSKQTSAH